MAWYFNPFTCNFDYYVIGSAPTPTNAILLEDGTALLLEDGTALLLES